MATTHRTCTTEDCDKPHRAKGLCATHYNQQLPTRYKMHSVRCSWCGTSAQKYSAKSRYSKEYCGTTCRDLGRRNVGPTSPLPKDHWGLWYGTVSKWSPPKRKLSTATFQCGLCCECATPITEPAKQTNSSYCSMTCKRRSKKRQRRAREYNAPGDFRFSDLMRQYARQGYVCAYCARPCDGLPDPEHVTPLSRGGRNDMSNLVAACRPCNADKNDLTLDEWAADRKRRGLPELNTKLAGSAYLHVYITDVTAAAWRNRSKEQMFERAA